jgi:hypothetical protein
MANITVSVSDDLKDAMDEHAWVNWSAVARESFQRRLSMLEKLDALLADSDLSETDVEKHSDELKERVWSKVKEAVR